MKSVIKWLLPVLVFQGVFAQGIKTPVFNFDRKSDKYYIDSLVAATKKRILQLDSESVSARNDSARLELTAFICYVYRSGTYNTDSTYDYALKLKSLAQKKGNVRYQVRALFFMEYYFRVLKKDFTEAMRMNYEAMRLMEKNPRDEERNLWRVNNNLGKLSLRMQKFDESVAFYQKALEHFSKDIKALPVQKAEIYQSMGLSYNQAREYEKSLAAYRKALSIITDNPGSASTTNFAYIYADIGIAEKDMGHEEEALKNLNLSLKYWEKLNNGPGMSTALSEIAGISCRRGDYEAAVSAAHRSLTLGGGLAVTRLKSYEVLAQAYEKLGKFEEALKYRKYFAVAADSARNAGRLSEMMALQAGLEKEKLESRLLQEKEMQEQRYIALRKQEEFNRLRSLDEKEKLMKTIENNKLQIQNMTLVARQKQAEQENTMKQLKINKLNHQLLMQSRTRDFLFTGLGAISIFGLVLGWFNHKLRNRNRALRQKHAEVAAALEKGQIIERKRIAGELHDSVNSILASVKMGLQVIQPATAKDAKLHNDVLKMVDNATREVRQISHNLLPAELEKQGFGQALRNLVNRLNLAEQTVFQFQEEGPVNGLSPDVAFNLYSICLELCQNIQKHSEARNACIEIRQTASHLLMFVSDDGKGFEVKAHTGGIGLKNVRHRAQSIGAVLKIQSNASEGTMVYLKLPFTPPVQA